MTESPLRLVVDASVAVKLFAPEALYDEANALFARLSPAGSCEFLVPEFFYLECANILWKWALRGYPREKAGEHLRYLMEIPLSLVPERYHAGAALGVALRYGVTAYDACYVALAAKHGVGLVTADERLVDRFRKSPFDVRWLGDPGAAR